MEGPSVTLSAEPRRWLRGDGKDEVLVVVVVVAAGRIAVDDDDLRDGVVVVAEIPRPTTVGIVDDDGEPPELPPDLASKDRDDEDAAVVYKLTGRLPAEAETKGGGVDREPTSGC